MVYMRASHNALHHLDGPWPQALLLLLSPWLLPLKLMLQSPAAAAAADSCYWRMCGAAARTAATPSHNKAAGQQPASCSHPPPCATQVMHHSPDAAQHGQTACCMSDCMAPSWLPACMPAALRI
jgi:hypothetical protein